MGYGSKISKIMNGSKFEFKCSECDWNIEK